MSTGLVCRAAPIGEDQQPKETAEASFVFIVACSTRGGSVCTQERIGWAGQASSIHAQTRHRRPTDCGMDGTPAVGTACRRCASAGVTHRRRLKQRRLDQSPACKRPEEGPNQDVAQDSAGGGIRGETLNDLPTPWQSSSLLIRAAKELGNRAPGGSRREELKGTRPKGS